MLRDVAKEPGGACDDTRKLFVHCANKNDEAFEMEQKLQAARAAGAIIPEYADWGQSVEVYWGPVPDTFVPSLPADVVRAKFKEHRTAPGAGASRVTSAVAPGRAAVGGSGRNTRRPASSNADRDLWLVRLDEVPRSRRAGGGPHGRHRD
jgi:hypothetical protein